MILIFGDSIHHDVISVEYMTSTRTLEDERAWVLP